MGWFFSRLFVEWRQLFAQMLHRYCQAINPAIKHSVSRSNTESWEARDFNAQQSLIPPTLSYFGRQRSWVTSKWFWKRVQHLSKFRILSSLPHFISQQRNLDISPLQVSNGESSYFLPVYNLRPSQFLMHWCTKQNPEILLNGMMGSKMDVCRVEKRRFLPSKHEQSNHSSNFC